MNPAARPAQLSRRVLAYVIDGAVVAVLIGIMVIVWAGVLASTRSVGAVLITNLVCGVVLLAWLLVYTAMQGGAGSIGMRVMKLRLARIDADGTIGFGRALGRNLIWALAGWIVVGYFSPLFDSSPWHRGWHDLAAGSVMTDVRGAETIASVSAAPSVSAETTVTTGSPSADAASGAVPKGPAIVASFDPWDSAQSPTPASAPSGPSISDAKVAASDGGLISIVPGISHSSGHTPSLMAPAPATVSPAPTPPAPNPPPASGPIDQTRIASGDRAFATLIWDDGTRQAVYTRTLFGRNPAPESGAQVAPIRDETLSLSKTHFEILADDQRQVCVVDRHSTNGVAVRRGGDVAQVTPGERVALRRGDVLEFGDRHVTVEVSS